MNTHQSLFLVYTILNIVPDLYALVFPLKKKYLAQTFNKFRQKRSIIGSANKGKNSQVCWVT